MVPSKIRERPKPVVLIAALMGSDETLVAEAKGMLVGRFGPIARESEPFPFTYSSYYEAEMGTGLVKRFVAFRDLVEMERLPQVKHTAMEIEEALAMEIGGVLRRRVNIDPGYVALSRLVLASRKDRDHRLYLGDGVFAEVALRYRRGRFEPLDWTYADYRTELAQQFFSEVRVVLWLDSQ